MRKFLVGAAIIASAFSIPAMAQDSSYTPTTVWQVSSIKVLPGQFETYLDYLGSNWRKQMELGKKEGLIVSYHIFAVNNSRDGEPDLMLAIEYADYMTVAQQLDFQKKFQAVLKMDSHAVETKSGERAPMRTQAGSMEWQELKLK